VRIWLIKQQRSKNRKWKREKGLNGLARRGFLILMLILLNGKTTLWLSPICPALMEKLKLIHGEYGIGDYQRVFTLSGDVNREKIEATVNNGVLKIVLPKAEAAKTKKIAVRAETK
jgi:hypothetical protein